MSKLDDLINTLCPSGVEYKTLGEVCEIARGASPRPIHNYLTDKENGIPWIKIGDVEVNSKYVEETAEFVTKEGAEKSRLVKKGDFILSNSMSFGRPYILKIDGCIHDGWIYMRNYESLFLTDFLYYLLRSSKVQHDWRQRVSSGTVSNLNSDIVKATLIPVPPLEVQYEIVRILDKFTSLEAELEAELEARRKQYEYYRDSLLTFGDDVEWKALGDIATDIYRGSGIKRDQVTSEGIPCVRYGEIYTSYNIHFNDCISHTIIDNVPSPKYFEHGDILFAITGESVEDIAKSIAYMGNEKCLAGGDIVVLKHNQNPKYLSFALSTNDAIMQKGKGKVKSKVVHSSVPSISEIKIPIPDLETQEKIANILDNFLQLTNNITSGLPAEIEARHKQYEYYRDKLLSFKRKEG